MECGRATFLCWRAYTDQRSCENPMKATPWTVLLVALAFVTCDSGPTTPPERDPDPDPGPLLGSLELSLPAVIEDTLGVTVTATVTALDRDSTPMEVPPEVQLQIRDERPHFPGSSVVVKEGALSLRTVWPGEVTVRATASGIASSPVDVRVEPSQPIVDRLLENHVVAGERATLTGYRLDLVDSVALSAMDTVIRIVSQTPDTLRFTVPYLGLSTAGCDPSSTAGMNAEGARLYGPAPILRYGQGRVVDFAPGEFEIMGIQRDECLTFLPDAGAEYTLVYADVRPIIEAETVPEGHTEDWYFGTLRVSVGDGTVNAAARHASAGTSVTAGTPSFEGAESGTQASTVHASDIPGNYVVSIFRPLEVGEQVSVDDDSLGYQAARVLKRYGQNGEVVLLGLESEGASQDLAGGSFNIDPEMQTLADAMPTLRTALSENFPSDYGTGQAVFLIRSWDEGGLLANAQATGGRSPGGTPTGYVIVRTSNSVDWNSGGPPAERIHASVLIHEAAHLAQGSRQQDLCVADPENGCAWPLDRWALEGGADFVAGEAYRRVEGFGYAANTYPPTRAMGATTAGFSARGPVYQFDIGYQSAAWFFRYLMARAIDAGLSENEALDQVAKAAFEPWYGWVTQKYWDPATSTIQETEPYRAVPGLVPRMREVLGPDWDPVDAFVRGATIVAVDDLTSNPELQDPTYGQISELYAGPFAEIQLGSGDVVDLETRPWTFGWARIWVPTDGGDLSFGSPQDVRWVLVRTR